MNWSVESITRLREKGGCLTRRTINASFSAQSTNPPVETFSLPVECRILAYVFKRELLFIPFFGWAMACLNMIHIDRSARGEA